MKKNLLRSMFSAVALFGGMMAAQADNVTLKPTESTVIQANGNSATNADVALYGQDLHCSQSKISDKAFSNMLSKYEGSPVVITKFDASSALEGKTLTAAKLKFYSKCTVSGKNSDVQVALIGTNWDAKTATWNNTNTAEIMDAVAIHDGGDGQGGTNISASGGYVEVDVKDYLSADEDKVIAFGIYTFTGRDQAISEITLTIDAADAASMTTYTVKFEDGNGNTLKEAVNHETLIGSNTTAPEEDLASFFNADKTMKYIYASGNQEITVDATAENNVITLVFREAEKYAYTLKSSLGETLKEGTDWEGETPTVAYPRHQLSEGTLYSIAANTAAKDYFERTFTLSEDNQVETITYTETETTNVVFLSEAEEISTLTLSTAPNSNIRCSNGLCAYNAGPDDAVIATLPVGKYKLYTSIWGNATTEFVFKAGNTQLTATNTDTENKFISRGYIQDYESEEFEINYQTDITLAATDNAARGIDFVYIVKTGEAEEKTPVANSIAELKAIKTGLETELKLNDAVVTSYYGGNNQTYSIIEDATGAVKANTNISKLITKGEGSTLNGSLLVSAQVSNGIYTISTTANTDATTLTETEGTATPTVKTLAEAVAADDAMVLTYVKLENVELGIEEDQWGYKSYYLVSGEDKLPITDTFMQFPEAMPEITSFNSIPGFIGKNYKGALEFYPYGEYEAVCQPATEVSNIAALKALPNGKFAKLTLTNAQIKVYVAPRMWGNPSVFVEDETAGIQVNLDNEYLSDNFNELGKTFNGTLYCCAVSESGVTYLTASDSTSYSTLTTGTADVVAKEVAFEDATIEKYDTRLISIKDVKTREPNMDAGEMMPAMEKDGKTIVLSDLFSKLPMNEDTYDYIFYDNCNVEGLLMTGVVGMDPETDDYIYGPVFVPTSIVESEPAPVIEHDYAVAVGETHDDGDEITSVKDIVMIYGGDGEGDKHTQYQGKADANVEGYVASVGGNSVNPVDAAGKSFDKSGATVPTRGTYYVFKPVYDGTLTVGVVLNANKKFYIVEDGVALPDYNGITVSEKYYGTYEFEVKGGSTYYVFCTGSKLGFYGFDYDSKGVVDAIRNVDSNVNTLNGAVYTVNGVKVRNAGESLEGLAKGLYIIGGKKVVVK